jgi:hypothetical protein
LLFTHPSFSIIEETKSMAPRAIGITRMAAEPDEHVGGFCGSNGVLYADIVASFFGVGEQEISYLYFHRDASSPQEKGGQDKHSLFAGKQPFTGHRLHGPEND